MYKWPQDIGLLTSRERNFWFWSKATAVQFHKLFFALWEICRSDLSSQSFCLWDPICCYQEFYQVYCCLISSVDGKVPNSMLIKEVFEDEDRWCSISVTKVVSCSHLWSHCRNYGSQVMHVHKNSMASSGTINLI